MFVCYAFPPTHCFFALVVEKVEGYCVEQLLGHCNATDLRFKPLNPYRGSVFLVYGCGDSLGHRGCCNQTPKLLCRLLWVSD